MQTNTMALQGRHLPYALWSLARCRVTLHGAGASKTLVMVICQTVSARLSDLHLAP